MARSHRPQTYFRTFDSIPGWFDRADAALFCLFDHLQRKGGIQGDILEIGVYGGKSATLLGFLCAECEELHVCDPFEQISRREFEATYLRFHGRLPRVLQVQSQDLGSELSDGSFRFVHIDGAHDYDAVRTDIATARRVLRPGGVVVFDDFPTFEYPDVTAAVLDEMRSGALVPCVLSQVKLYATWTPLPGLEPDALLATVRADRHLAAETRSLFGRQIVAAWGPPTLGYAIRTRAPTLYARLLRMYRALG